MSKPSYLVTDEHVRGILLATVQGMTLGAIVRRLEEKGHTVPENFVLTMLKKLCKQGRVYTSRDRGSELTIYHALQPMTTKHPNAISWCVEQIVGRDYPNLISEVAYGDDARREGEEAGQTGT